MPEPIWLQHPTYTNYEVSDDGRVRSIAGWTEAIDGRVLPRRSVVLKPSVDKKHLKVGVWADRKRRSRYVHVLVCEAFHGLKPTKEFQQDSLRHGTQAMAAKTHCKHGHELTPDNVRLAVQDGSQKRRCRTCARRASRDSAMRKYWAGRERPDSVRVLKDALLELRPKVQPSSIATNAAIEKQRT